MQKAIAERGFGPLNRALLHGMVWYGMVRPDRTLGDHHVELRDPGVQVEQLHARWGLGTGAQPDGVELI